jgi:aromatic-L-amino-acid/L-tryptophan decarboxylase
MVGFCTANIYANNAPMVGFTASEDANEHAWVCFPVLFPHRWLLTTFDCAAMWLDDTQHLKAALSLTPVFLRGQGNAMDYKDWQLPLGRRFRALKLWMLLRLYGAEQLRALLRHHIALGLWFADRVQEHPGLELAAPPRFGLTCFRLAHGDCTANKALLAAINAAGALAHGQHCWCTCSVQRSCCGNSCCSLHCYVAMRPTDVNETASSCVTTPLAGPIFIVGTELSGRFTLRFAVGNAHTQLEHVQRGWEIVRSHVDAAIAELKRSNC